MNTYAYAGVRGRIERKNGGYYRAEFRAGNRMVICYGKSFMETFTRAITRIYDI